MEFFSLTLNFCRFIISVTMKKTPPKSTKKTRGKDGYTVTEVGTLIDGFRSEFKVFGENQKNIIKKLDATYEQVGINTERLSIVEVVVKKNSKKIGNLETAVKENTAKIGDLETAVTKLDDRITNLEVAVKDIISKIDALTKSIDNLAKTKVDREEMFTLEKRISLLETKVASLSQ